MICSMRRRQKKLTFLRSYLGDLDDLVSRLAQLLSSKTTSLPPAAAEDLRTSIRSMTDRLVEQADTFLDGETDPNRAYLYRGIDASKTAGTSVSEQLYSLSTVVSFLFRQIDSESRARRPEVEELPAVLLAIRDELTKYLVQLQDRRLDQDYIELAVREIAPFSVHGVMPLKKSGFLVVVNSPGLSFETSAPNIGLGESPADIAVDVYLDTDDNKVADEVLSRVDALVKTLGYRQVGNIEIQRGSVFRRSRASADQVADELKSRLMKVERAFELAQLELRQADVDNKEAEAVNKLRASLENVPRACLRVGSILVIKYPHATAGQPVVIVRNLSQLELHALSQFPEIQRSPETALQALTMTLDNIPKEYNQPTGGDPGCAPSAT
jgi:hypothetical protein